MKFNGRLLGYSLIVGLLATITMDLTAFVMFACGFVRLGPYRIIPNLLGRWVGSFPSGRIFHSTILESAPVAHEAVIGILCHYLIGVSLAAALAYPIAQLRRQKVPLKSAIFYGICTCGLPWFLMFPAMGFGAMALKTNSAGGLLSFSLINHFAFGVGIFVWSNFLSRVPQTHGPGIAPSAAT